MKAYDKTFNEIQEELEAVKAKKKNKKPREKRDWYGLVYCGDNGWTSIIGDNCQGVWLGKTNEIIPYLKSKHIDGEKVDSVLMAVEEFWSARKSQSCHLATEVDAPYVFPLNKQSNRATLLDNDTFRKLLEESIKEGYGIPTMQNRLKEAGYEVPYRTLGRWVKKMRGN